MMKRILPSIIFGTGVSVVLYGGISDLPLSAYLTNIIFWPLFVMPSGLLWKNKFLNAINQGQFPSQMKSYRQLFLYSKKAIVYQLFLNQFAYHTILGITYMSYTYYLRTLYDKITPRKSFSHFIRQSLFDFFKLRVFFATVSLLTQFWGAKLSLAQVQGNLRLSSQAIRLLLIKQYLLSMIWMTSVVQLAHRKYPLDQIGLEKTSKDGIF